MTDVLSQHLGKLIEIANRAIEAEELDRLAAMEKADLHDAYQDFKERNGIDHIAVDTPEWEKMMGETNGEYAASETAKRKAYNAKRRLKTAISRYRAA